MKLKKIILPVIWWGLLLVSGQLGAQPAGGPQQQVRDILQLKANSKTDFSIHFVDPATGQTIFQHRCDAAQIPASNMKLVTTAAAVEVLGADFVYQTVLGLLEGSLVIIAGGDPLLGDPVMAAEKGLKNDEIFDLFLAQLQQRKITHINRDLLIDDFLFDDVRFHPSWPVNQANNWFAAEVSALNFNDNCIDVTISPAAQAGQLAGYAINPNTSYVNITNECITAAKGTNTCWAARQLGANHITLKSEVRNEDTIYVTVARPSAFFGHLLAEHLLQAGINIDGRLIIKQIRGEKGRPPANFEVLLTYRTPLKEVLLRANRDSLNLAAECLFKTAGAYYKPPGATENQQGGWPGGRRAVNAFLEKLQVDPNQYQIDDGSGLSRENRLSARCLTQVLSYMYRHPAGEMFRQTLATPENGTLKKKRRFSEPAYQGRIFAKTGYISGAWALSGYCRTADGQWLAFSILAQNATAGPVPAMDEIVKIIMK